MGPYSIINLLIEATAEIKIKIIMIEDPNRINGFMRAKYTISLLF